MEEKEKAPLTPVTFDEFPPVSYEEWKAEAIASLKGAPFEKKLLTKTYEGLTLEPLYTRDMAEEQAQRLTFPGAGDYARGVNAGGYLSHSWATAQGADGADAASANAMLKEGLSRGADCIKLDVSDNPCFQNLDDVIALLDGICLNCNELDLFAGATALPALALLKARGDKLGKSTAKYHGCVGADPIGVYARTGRLQAKLECYYKQMAAAVRFTSEQMPLVKTILVDATVYHNGGADAVSEVAIAMAVASGYIQALLDQGCAVDQAAASIRFNFALGADFFMQIAKLRAARMIWAQIVKAYGGSEQAGKIDVTASVSEFTKTAYDPYVNILRATTQAFSGVVGGVDTLSVTPFDSAVRPSDELSRRVARNISLMMGEEFGLTQPVDPAGGSWFVESLTGQLAQAIWDKFQAIEASGGAATALRSNSLQQEIAATLDKRFRNLATRYDRAVGVNMYANMSEQPLAQPERAVVPAKKGVTLLSHIDHNVQAAADAFAAGALYADVAKALCCGDSPDIRPIAPRRWTEQFEALRSATEGAAAKGQTVRVFLCNMGPIPQHKARADFSAGFMETAGFTVLRNDGFATVEQAIAAAQASGAEVAVICSSDATYPELVPALASGLKAALPGVKVLLAGAPPAELKPEWDQAGVDDYIHVKADCLAILTAIQKERGIC